ncbi:MAG: amidohydrolase [bacterium]|nr:amidohydrolase [bacterium]
MSRPIPTLAILAFLVSACAVGPFAPSPYADVVFFGEHIHTVDDATAGARAVAIKGENIAGVGSREDVAPLVGPDTRIVELGERALVPGFIDAHGHFTMAVGFLNMLNASSPPVGPMESIDDIVEGLAARIEELEIPAGEFVTGYGYDDSLLAENRHPDRDDLDRASTEHPIVLIHVSGHLATANSLALEHFGFDETTEDPFGGVIRRRPGTTIPNGVLEEVAAHIGLEPVMLAAQNVSPREFAAQVAQTVDYHASFGITTVQDGASSPEVVKGLKTLARFRPPAIDIAVFPVIRSDADSEDPDAIGYTPDYENGVRVAGVKFVLDGSPQGRTAWLTEPYDEGPPGADPDYVAYPMVEPAFYKKHVKRMLDARIPILAHANGDAAIDLMIEGIDEALGGEPKDHRSVTIHAQLAREDQLDRMKALGIVPSFFAAHPFFWGDWHRKSFGDDRAMRISPLRSSLDRDLPFTIHNDAMVVPPHMLRLIEIAMGRKTREGVVLGEDQRVSFEEALHAVTLGSAYQYFEEDRKGSITPGKRADLVVLAEDPAWVRLDDVSEVAVVETFARGVSIYTAD